MRLNESAGLHVQATPRVETLSLQHEILTGGALLTQRGQQSGGTLLSKQGAGLQVEGKLINSQAAQSGTAV